MRYFFFVSFTLVSLATIAAPQALDLEEQFIESREKVIQNEKKKRQILSKLFHLSRKIKKISEEKGNLSYELVVLNSQAKRVAKKINKLEVSITKQKTSLNKRLRALYKIRGQGYLRALFSASTPQDLERNTRFLSIVAKNDFELINSYRQSRSELVKQRSALKRKVRKLLAVKKKIRASEAELSKEQKLKAQLAKSIEKQKSWYLTQIKELRQKSKGIEIDGNSLLNSRLFFEKKGKLTRPIQQPVAQKYGLKTLGIHGTQFNHKGIRFASGTNHGVHSIFAGTVEYAGPVAGLGQVVILDHSDHYYSVYADLSEINVVERDEVEAEIVIGKANRRGLYFEIRHYSQPENPESWLKPEQIRVSSVESESSSGGTL